MGHSEVGFPSIGKHQSDVCTGGFECVADFLSHHMPLPGEWRLNPKVVQMIWHRFGRANVDLFDSEESTLPSVVLMDRNVQPVGSGCTSTHLAFPPTPLILPTLHRIRRGHYKVLLVAPNWTGRPWFPSLYKL